MENRYVTDIRTAERVLRNQYLTTGRKNLPFAAASPLTADTDSGLSTPEQFARRQLVQHGSAYLGKEMTKAGLAAIAYGSQPVDLKRTSHLMPRDSIGPRS